MANQGRAFANRSLDLGNIAENAVRICDKRPPSRGDVAMPGRTLK
jgi:hypothetical protein